MNAVRFRRQEDFSAGGGIILSGGTHRHHAARPCIDVKESIGAEVFRKRNLRGPGTVFQRNIEMLRTDSDCMGIKFFGRFSGNEVHFRRANKSGNEERVWPVVEFKW